MCTEGGKQEPRGAVLERGYLVQGLQNLTLDSVLFWLPFSPLPSKLFWESWRPALTLDLRELMVWPGEGPP